MCITLKKLKIIFSFVCIFLCSIAVAAPMLLGEQYKASASSELSSSRDAYSPRNLIGPSLETAWCEGGEGDGVGEWVEINLNEPIEGKGGVVLEILPGFVKSYSLFLKNGRPQKLAVEVNDTLIDTPLILKNYGKVQSFQVDFTGKPVKKIRLKILSVYRGTLFSDTCITDIVIRKRFPKGYWNESEAKKESGMLINTFYDKNHTILSSGININSLDFAMWLGDGIYYKGGEGSEMLNELYLTGMLNRPQIFLWVLDKQQDSIVDVVIKAITSPVDDKYSDSQIRNAIQDGLENLEVGSYVRLKPLLDAYSIAINPRKAQ